ncbi:hypothetical protein PR202_gb10394 [Eleusine coracana subsp. coracana]|uniref:Uncharacterized protein n=1 Tax=Eleusine coracana subsp. coracana TaxID=191504 RepID=A0AAV5EKL4_ELECO|nr:hypothetical protein QOZ80_3BG0255000 [Eleusine coracana subsp. coracana]GJN22795.1 hypothetical protein PR202_gb10394 [Eleusine coracana subsp. coracana]
MSVQVARPAAAGLAPWPYVEYMARWERQVERRQLFLRSYHFSRDADHASRSPRARARRVVWAGLRRLRRAAATGLRRLRARLRLCFGWATRRRSRTRPAGFRYGRLSGKARSTVCFWR